MKIKSNIMLALIVAFVAIFIMIKYVRADSSKKKEIKMPPHYNPAAHGGFIEEFATMV